MRERADAVVIGAGSNGLAAALRLASAGRQVIVLEAREQSGGLARPHEFVEGYQVPLRAFDCGWVPPRVSSQIGVLAPATGEPAHSVSLAIGNGELLSLPSRAESAQEAIRPHSSRDARRWGEFVSRLRTHANILEQFHELPPPHIETNKASEILPLLRIVGRARARHRDSLTDLLRVAPMPVSDLADDWFESDLLKAVIAAGAVQNIRQGPRSGGTTYLLLHHLLGARPGSVRARPHFTGGPAAYVESLERECAARGVRIRTAQRVARILVRDYGVSAVVLAGGEEVECRAVVSTADSASTLLRLVEPEWLDPELIRSVGNIKYRGCTGYVCYALDALPDRWSGQAALEALAGTISLSPAMDGIERAFDAVKYGELSASPHVEITIPSLRWPVLAPPGKQVLLARVQYVPYAEPATADAGSAIERWMMNAADASIDAALPGLLSRATSGTIITPADLAAAYGLTEGAESQGELMLDQVLFMRPVPELSRYATPIEGLFLGGTGCHPGPGVHAAAGLFAANALLRAARPRSRS